MRIRALLTHCCSSLIRAPLLISLLGSAFFYFGSFLLFPYIFSIMESIRYASTMILIASVLLALSVMWETMGSWCCCKTTLKRICLQILELVSWIAFLVGSVLGSPYFDLRYHRDLVYTGALSALFVVHLVKTAIFVFGSDIPAKQVMVKSRTIFYSLAYWALALLLCLLGTLVFLKSQYRQYLSVIGPAFYVFGGLAFFISKLYLWRLVKPERPKEKAEVIELQEEKSCQIGAFSKRQQSKISAKDTNGGYLTQ